MTTYFRDQPAPARRVRVRVGPSPTRAYWCAALAGTERDAVAIDMPDGLVLIDDEDGSGWTIVHSMYGSGGGWKLLPPTSEIIAERSD